MDSIPYPNGQFGKVNEKKDKRNDVYEDRSHILLVPNERKVKRKKKIRKSKCWGWVSISGPITEVRLSQQINYNKSVNQGIRKRVPLPKLRIDT